MVNKKIVIICSVIALIITAGLIGYNIIKINKNGETDQENNTIQNTTNVINQNTAENVNTTENNIETQNAVENNLETENEKNKTSETTTAKEEKENKNKTEKALKLVKEEWGEDDTVYYTIDNTQGNSYFITVRSKSTTESLAEYEVDVTTNEVILR